MKKLFYLLFLTGIVVGLQAQNVTITPTGITPSSGSSYPRLSYEAILTLPSPQKGDIAYDITFECLRVYTGNKWLCSYQQPGDFTPNSLAIASAGDTDYDSGFGIAVDGAGNVYVTGAYSGTATFGTTPKTSAGLTDIFVAKYNNSGNLLWIQSAGGAGEDYGNVIAVDGAGNVYVTGTYSSTATFGSTNKTSAGSYDVFIAKYNSAGAVQWVQSAGGTGLELSYGMVLDGTGNIYLTGFFTAPATFGSIVKNNGGSYVAKYSGTGGAQWVTAITGNAHGQDIAIDLINNVYVTGYFSSAVNFGAGGLNKTALGNNDVFLAKYLGSTGVPQWVQSAGGANSSIISQGITVDAGGDIYITGYFFGTVTFSTAPVAISKTSVGSNDVFIAKYNTAGAVQWVQSAGGTGEDVSRRITVDGTGNVYITGYYSSEIVTFRSITKPSSGENDVFVAKYNTDTGLPQWVQTAGGTGDDRGEGIAVDGSGNIYITGSYSDSITVGRTSNTSTGINDMFVMRLDK